MSPAAAFSRPIEVDDLPDEGLATTIEADADECRAVAAQLGLPGVAALTAGVRIVRGQGRRIEVGGDVAARITQNCVVSLEPFESEIAQPIEAAFAPVAEAPAVPQVRSRRRQARAEPAPAPPPVDAGVDAPDPLIGGRIDLGALAVEFLALGLDPYPRKPGVQFTDIVAGESEAGPPSAFAALARLKDRS